jgi:hypothetical protein
VARRCLGLGLALLLGWVAWQLHDREQLAAPWMERWAQEHPGPRDPDAAALERVAHEFAVDRRGDLFGLSLSLAVAALALAVSPRSWLASQGSGLRLLAVGALAGGLVGMVTSVSETSRLAALDRWTLSDQSLPSYVGALSETMIQWREIVPEDNALIVVGTNDFLLSRLGWAMFPRPVHPVVLSLPPGLDLEGLAALAAEVSLGQSAPGRWLVDLDALASRRPALVRVEP